MRTPAALVLGSALLLMSQGCSDSSAQPQVTVQQDCADETDCAVGQICQGGACVCVEPGCVCTTNAGCVGALLCDGNQGVCFEPECLADNACLLGEVCTRGRCEADLGADRDRDGLPDAEDNCPEDDNADQKNNDADNKGDACDNDDDNDGVPDVADNCPFAVNTGQADANDNGLGNACDEAVRGISVVGTLNFLGSGNPDTNNAQVFVTGRQEPVGISPEGAFVFEQVLAEPGPFAIRVEWQGFVTFERVFQAFDKQTEIDVGSLMMVPESDDAQRAVSMLGTARLEGRQTHQGILVRLSVGAVPVASTITAADGSWVLSASRVDHTVEFSRPGFLPQSIDVVFDIDEARFETGGEPLEDFDGLTLRPDRSSSLDGQLASPIEGQDFSDAVVVLVDNEARRRLAVEPNGRFGQIDLSAGLYGLEVDVAGHEPIRRFETLGEGANSIGVIGLVPIEVTMLGKVVTLIDGDQRPLDGVSLRLRRDDRLVASTDTDEQGDFVFRALPVAYTLSISAANFLSQSLEVEFDNQGFTVDGEPLSPQTPFVLVRTPESDRDSDGVIDVLDNCPEDFNSNQRNVDGDEAGDACDADADGDGLINGLDNCPFSPNPMQEDTDGFGRGTACSLGTAERPIEVACGVSRQHLNTQERIDRLQGSCGGSGAPEVVYELGINEGEVWSVTTEADFPRVIYLIDARGREADCVVGGRAQFGGEGFEQGTYRLVVDGFSDGDTAGKVSVSIASEQACSVSHPATASNFDVGTNPLSLALGDLDGDDLPDIVTANINSNDVSVLFGDGDGTFAPEQTFPTGERPTAVALADLNDDGHLDIAVANEGDDTVGVLFGDGAGDFAPPTDLPCRKQPQIIGVGRSRRGRAP